MKTTKSTVPSIKGGPVIQLLRWWERSPHASARAAVLARVAPAHRALFDAQREHFGLLETGWYPSHAIGELGEQLYAHDRPDALERFTRDAARGSMAPNAVAHRSGAPVAQRAAADKPSVVGALHPEIPHWGYEGAGGPNAWGSLRSEFAQCAAGQRQSPIDIRDGLAVDLDPVRFDYQPSRFSVVDNGHTVQANIAPGNAIEVGSRRYELVQLHFHRPSEERIDGRQFEMSVHLVHKDAQGRLVVVAVLLEKGPAQPVVQSVWNNLPLEKKEEVAARAMLDPAGLLPADRRYYTYMGSLTTPPCSEGVQWVVMRAPMTAAAEQIELFTRIYPMNARPLQSAAGRRILQSN